MAGGLITLLIWVLVLGLVAYLFLWLLGMLGLPEPFNTVARVIIVVIVVLILINLLLGMAGGMPHLSLR